MFYLLIVSFVWAFSFGLIKGKLAGLDANAVAAMRLAMATLIFLPFLRLRGVKPSAAIKLALIGAVEFGAMYMLYLHAFEYLKAYEVALFSIATPLYVAALEAIAQKRFNGWLAVAALLATAGAGVVAWQSVASQKLLPGFCLMQASNLCFALGQFFYRRVRTEAPAVADLNLFGLLYLGALAVALPVTLFAGSWAHFSPNKNQWLVLTYLGIVASGLCFFWWNVGATRVSAATLAAFNDAKVPLGVACSLLFFGESANLTRLLVGGGLMLAAILLAETKAAK
ncbi:MAG: EamA family transporter [Nibricoccus sp.]